MPIFVNYRLSTTAGSKSPGQISLAADFSQEELSVLHKLITEFAAKRHIQLTPTPSASESNESETEAASPPQAMAKAKKTAGKRKIDEVETDVAEPTVDTSSRKRRRTQPSKYVEPETVETEAEPTAMPIAEPTTTKKLSAKRRRKQARALTLEAE